jgi:hypothetical protein
MKKLLCLIPIIALALCAGCSTTKPIVTPALIQSGVSTAVRYGTTKYPTSIPAVRVATEVICSAANGTNVSPAEIVAAIESSNFESLKTPEAIFITQSIITIYTGAWNAFGSDVDAASEIKPYLQAVCNGGVEGLAPVSISRVAIVQRWPQLRFK